MKIKIAVLTLASFLMLMSVPTMAIAKDFSGFDVSEIFVEEVTDDGEQSIIGKLEETAAKDETGNTSPAMLLILRAINILTLLVGTFAFVMILIGGFVFATSGGDETKVDKGKAILTQSIVGLVFAFLSYSIVVFVQSFLYN
jgi:hypothetical protein